MKKRLIITIMILVVGIPSSSKAYYCAPLLPVAPAMHAASPAAPAFIGGGAGTLWPFLVGCGAALTAYLLVMNNVDAWTPLFPSVEYTYPAQH